MHLIVMSPSAQGQVPLQPGADFGPLLERWTPLMGRLQPAWTLTEDTEALDTLAQRAHAQLVLGRLLTPRDNGRLALRAWARLADAPEPGDSAIPQAATAVGRLTLCHGLVGSDRITLLGPQALELQAQESRDLHASIEPLFSSEGVALRWLSPLCWEVEHPSLGCAPCASLERAQGDSVQRWQGRMALTDAPLIRRLQSEAQMVLHEHPVNQQRAQRGALTANSLWLDQTGAVGNLGDEPAPSLLRQRLLQTRLCGLAQIDDALRDWVGAALASTLEVPKAAAPDPSPEAWPLGTHPTLVLCGRQRAQAFTARAVPAGWRGVLERTLRRPPKMPSLREWLATLDAPDDDSEGDAPVASGTGP